MTGFDPPTPAGSTPLPPPPPGGGPPPAGPMSPASPAAPAGSPGREPGGASRGLIIGAVVALLAIVGVAIFFITRDGDDDAATDDVTVVTVVTDTDVTTEPTDDTDDTTESTDDPDVTVDPDTSLAGDGTVPAATEEPIGLGDDEALDQLAEGCFDGEMQDCDDLYDQADSGSDYQRYGDTCAGRQPEDTQRYCAAAFPGD